MTLLAIIPARGGSKGIPRKNIRPLAGKPLIGYTIEAALKVEAIDRLIVSTDDEEIARIATQFGAEVPFLRPNQIAKDETASIETVLHAVKKLDGYSKVLLLQPTSPLRNVEDINGIINLQHTKKCPSVVSITLAKKHPNWIFTLNDEHLMSPVIKNSQLEATRQKLEKSYVLNGAMYLCESNWIKEHRIFINHETLGYIMPEERSVDIDSQLDWLWAETLIGLEKNE